MRKTSCLKQRIKARICINTNFTGSKTFKTDFTLIEIQHQSVTQLLLTDSFADLMYTHILSAVTLINDLMLNQSELH